MYYDSYSLPLASRYPREIIEFEWEAPSTSRFPTSSVRPDVQPSRSATPPRSPPSIVEPRYDPLGVLKQAEQEARRAAALDGAMTVPRSLMSVPSTHEIAPGVLSDGSITANYPVLRDYLRQVKAHPEARLPPPTSAPLFALGALATFYRPTHPAHWIFWSKEQTKNTAEIVQKVLCTNPAPISSPISWIGIPENLWILGSVQHAYRPILADIPWHALLNPSALASPSGGKRMSLRKRKAPAGAMREETPSEVAGEAELASPPPKKKPRTRRIVGARPRMALLSDANTETVAYMTPQDASENDSPAVFTKEAKAEHMNASPALPSLTPLTVTSALSDANPESPDPQPVRMSLRQKERKERAKSPSSTPAPPLGLLRMPPPLGRSDSASSSYSSGDSTVVSRGRSASSGLDSNLSLLTAVGDGNAEQKSAKSLDADEDMEKGGEEDESAAPMTRTRSRGARISTRQSAKSAPYHKDKDIQTAQGRGKGVKVTSKKAKARGPTA